MAEHSRPPAPRGARCRFCRLLRSRVSTRFFSAEFFRARFTRPKSPRGASAMLWAQPNGAPINSIEGQSSRRFAFSVAQPVATKLSLTSKISKTAFATNPFASALSLMARVILFLPAKLRSGLKVKNLKTAV